MRLLLISVSKKWQGRVYKEYPHGVGILGTLAHNEGHELYILDMALDERTPKEVIDKFKPDVIGLSFLSPSNKEAYALIDFINTVYNGHLIAGGIHSTLYPIDVVNQGVDIVIKGEGELVFLPLLSYLEGKNKKEYTNELNNIPNLVYKNIHDEIVETERSTDSVDLNSLPVMNRKLFRLDLYSHHSILTSRGCPYRCRFCCYWAPGGKSGRVMSSERIMTELEYLIENFGELQLYWADEIFFWTQKDRLDFCDLLIEKKLPISLTVQIRADLINDELVIALKKAGCDKICIGAESGSDNILKVANKKVKSKQIEEGIKACVRNGVKAKTWWIVGLPGGTLEDQLDTLDLIERAMPNEVAVHQFVPLPGSEFWDRADEYGINFPEQDRFENLNYYSDGSSFSFDYISKEQTHKILAEYERRLTELGYVSTDLADENTEYIYTSPSQKTTFKI